MLTEINQNEYILLSSIRLMLEKIISGNRANSHMEFIYKELSHGYNLENILDYINQWLQNGKF